METARPSIKQTFMRLNFKLKAVGVDGDPHNLTKHRWSTDIDRWPGIRCPDIYCYPIKRKENCHCLKAYRSLTVSSLTQLQRTLAIPHLFVEHEAHHHGYFLINANKNFTVTQNESKFDFTPKSNLLPQIRVSLTLVRSGNCRKPFPSFFCSFQQPLKNISDFLVKSIVQSIAQQLFPILDVFLCVWQHTNCTLTLQVSILLPLIGRIHIDFHDGDVTCLPSLVEESLGERCIN